MGAGTLVSARLDGHRATALGYEVSVGGVPRRISYDNTNAAVAKIVGIRERERTKEFQRLAGHFLFEAHFCLVRRPNEKGHVERLLDYGRRRCLVPIPQVQTLAELDDRLEAWCRQDLAQTARKQSVPKQVRLLGVQGSTWAAMAGECRDRRRFAARRVRVANAARASEGGGDGDCCHSRESDPV